MIQTRWRSDWWCGLAAGWLTGVLAVAAPAQKQALSTDRWIALGAERIAASDLLEAGIILQSAWIDQPDSILAAAWSAYALHLQNRLDEAAAFYARLLELDPPAAASAEKLSAIEEFLPRFFQVAGEAAPESAFAIHHPREPLVAYHLFWKSADLRRNNIPLDHRVVWVRYAADSRRVTGLMTLWGGEVVSFPGAAGQAGRQRGGARVNLLAGDHQPLAADWRGVTGRTRPSLELEEELESRLAAAGATGAGESPFTEPVELRLSRDEMRVSRWSSALLDRVFLAENFLPLAEWPDDPDRPSSFAEQADRRVGSSPAAVMTPAEALELRRALGPAADFLAELPQQSAAISRLPPRSTFDPETPRYPNLWLAAPVARFPLYQDFLEFVLGRLQEAGYRDVEVDLSEAADAAYSIEHLQPWSELRMMRHAHDFHIRLFWRRLEVSGTHRTSELGAPFPAGSFWLLAASVHYEVEHAHLLHASRKICPYCGLTGSYAGATGNFVVAVHDPLGLELALTGKIKGEPVAQTSGVPFPDLTAIFGNPAVKVLARPQRDDMNTAAVAIVEVAPRH